MRQLHNQKLIHCLHTPLKLNGGAKGVSCNESCLRLLISLLFSNCRLVLTYHFQKKDALQSLFHLGLFLRIFTRKV